MATNRIKTLEREIRRIGRQVAIQLGDSLHSVTIDEVIKRLPTLGDSQFILRALVSHLVTDELRTSSTKAYPEQLSLLDEQDTVGKFICYPDPITAEERSVHFPEAHWTHMQHHEDNVLKHFADMQRSVEHMLNCHQELRLIMLPEPSMTLRIAMHALGYWGKQQKFG